MKRWEYNTLRGEIMVFAMFLAVILFEVLSTFYILFWAENVCREIAIEMDCPEMTFVFAWVSRVVVVFYMWLAGWCFFHFAEKQGPL